MGENNPQSIHFNRYYIYCNTTPPHHYQNITYTTHQQRSFLPPPLHPLVHFSL